MIELTPVPAVPPKSTSGVVRRMIVCFDKKHHVLEFDRFVEEKKWEAWIILDACVIDWGSFVEYQMEFERCR